jgi:hypothetical protein
MQCFWDWLAALPPSGASFVGTVTGSCLGLIALLLGALFNARQNRKRDDALRKVDRIVLAKSIYAELRGVHRTLVENAQKLITDPPAVGEGFSVPDLQHSVQVFSHMLPKIGLLPMDVIQKVMDAYVLVQQYLDGIIYLGGTKQDMTGDRRAVFVDTVHAKLVSDINLSRATFIKDVMDALEPSLK